MFIAFLFFIGIIASIFYILLPSLAVFFTFFFLSIQVYNTFIRYFLHCFFTHLFSISVSQSIEYLAQVLLFSIHNALFAIIISIEFILSHHPLFLLLLSFRLYPLNSFRIIIYIFTPIIR
jgi:hypothetical protein